MHNCPDHLCDKGSRNLSSAAPGHMRVGSSKPGLSLKSVNCAEKDLLSHSRFKASSPACRSRTPQTAHFYRQGVLLDHFCVCFCFFFFSLWEATPIVIARGRTAKAVQGSSKTPPATPKTLERWGERGRREAVLRLGRPPGGQRSPCPQPHGQQQQWGRGTPAANGLWRFRPSPLMDSFSETPFPPRRLR